MNNIKRLRESMGLNQSALADKLGVRPPTIFKWENEIASPTVANLSAMADIFGCTMDHVIGRDNRL